MSSQGESGQATARTPRSHGSPTPAIHAQKQSPNSISYPPIQTRNVFQVKQKTPKTPCSSRPCKPVPKYHQTPDSKLIIITHTGNQRGRRVLVWGAGRALLVFGDRTWGAGSTFLEAALVVRARGAGAALALFLGMLRSPLFSLSSAEMSSLFRLTPRVDFGAAFATTFDSGFAGAGFGAATAGAAVRVRRAGAGADSLVSFASFASRAFLIAAGFWDAAAGSRISMSLVLRLLLGTRLTRRSMRDRRLAHCASDMATSFSFRALTGSTISAFLTEVFDRAYTQAQGWLAWKPWLLQTWRCATLQVLF